jgi:hypothetical protein
MNYFTYLEYFEDYDSFNSYKENTRRYSGLIYFFYKGYLGKIKIIRYDTCENEWLISDYTEEEIKPNE